jgi:hypothetical protein
MARYRVGRGEQGVLTVEPYKSRLLPLWRIRTPSQAGASAAAILAAFQRYKAKGDFVGMDMARKFLQMGYTRARRYARHRSGRKYAADGTELALEPDAIKQRSANAFAVAWRRVIADRTYRAMKRSWIMATAKQRAAARRNIRKAASAAKRKRTISKLPKKTRTALGKQGAKVARQERRKKKITA